MGAYLRRWPIVIVVLTLAECSGTRASAPHPGTVGFRPPVRQAPFDPSGWRTDFASVVSPLDRVEIAGSRAVGPTAAFDRRFEGRTLDFKPAGPGVMTDVQTRSRWDITGRAIGGPMRGAHLRRQHDLNAFWFAVAAFLPHARLVGVGSAS